MVIVIAVFNENVLLEMDLRTILLLQIREERYMLYRREYAFQFSKRSFGFYLNIFLSYKIFFEKTTEF